MTDIVERLREAAGNAPNHQILREAAAEIERLRIEVTRYRKGLREICDYLKQEPKP